jgi:hypothetical protein
VDNTPKKAGQAYNLTSSSNQKSGYTVVSSSTVNKLDLTPRSKSMGRDESILWPNATKDAAHLKRPHYRGVLRLSGGAGHYYNVGLWTNRRCFACWFTPFHKPHWHTGVEPVADVSTVKVQLTPSSSERDLFTGETRSARVELRPATANGKSVYWLKLIAKKEVGK